MDKAFFIAAMHRLICSPHLIGDGTNGVAKGRFRNLTPPAYGSKDCLCSRMTLRYNGEIVGGK